MVLNANPDSAGQQRGRFQRSPEAEVRETTDRALITRFLSGDETAFVEIMNHYSPSLFAVARRMVHNATDAEEITQDAFIRSYRNLPRFRGDCSLATWLYRIVTNLARNRYVYFRRRRRQDTVSLEREFIDQRKTVRDLIADQGPDAARETVNHEFSELVLICLDELEVSQRELLQMLTVHNLSYCEIGTRLRIKRGTVKSRIARARTNLKHLMIAKAPELGVAPAAADFLELGRRLSGPFVIISA